MFELSDCECEYVCGMFVSVRVRVCVLWVCVVCMSVCVVCVFVSVCSVCVLCVCVV